MVSILASAFFKMTYQVRRGLTLDLLKLFPPADNLLMDITLVDIKLFQSLFYQLQTINKPEHRISIGDIRPSICNQRVKIREFCEKIIEPEHSTFSGGTPRGEEDTRRMIGKSGRWKKGLSPSEFVEPMPIRNYTIKLSEYAKGRVAAIIPVVEDAMPPPLPNAVDGCSGCCVLIRCEPCCYLCSTGLCGPADSVVPHISCGLMFADGCVIEFVATNRNWNAVDASWLVWCCMLMPIFHVCGWSALDCGRWVQLSTNGTWVAMVVYWMKLPFFCEYVRHDVDAAFVPIWFMWFSGCLFPSHFGADPTWCDAAGWYLRAAPVATYWNLDANCF
ncbi:hypothetical protein Nepgr_032274 [Nepenthes gracilis]|uniref:Uncharacterized protein n=1 Tax=Nepenthes gracilis TaxID=150966 RepID=A0AAD3TJP8_NEPGR|nr:hypothetical protein Nepgr_032274 [Nepenthes gracilis]